MHEISILAIVLQILLLVAAALYDVATRLIPNGICVVLAIVGVVSRVQFGLGPVVISMGITAGMFLILMVLFVRRWLGGGDVKLLLAMMLGLTPFGTAMLFYVTALFGGVLGVAYLLMRRLPRRRVANGRSALSRIYGVERWRIYKRGSLPYGVAIACGGIWAVLATGVQ